MPNDLFNTIQSSYSALYRIVDIIVISIFFLAALYFHDVPLTVQYQLVLLINIASFLFFSQTLELYRSWRTSSTLTMMSYTTITWAIGCTILIVLAYFSKTGTYYSRLAIGVWFVSTAIALNLWRLIFRALLFRFRRSGLNTKQVIIIGATPTGINLANQIKDNPQLGLEIVGFYDDRPEQRLPKLAENSLMGTIAEGIDLVKKSPEISDVYIAMPMKAEDRITDILNQCSDTTATVHIIPDFFIYNILHARWQYIGNMQTLSIFDSPFEGFNHTLKRIEDLVIGSLILIIITIPMCFIALAVKLTSKGPIIFKQKRYGLDGKEIKIYKFRSMALIAKESNKVIQATKFDARVTPVGAFLRRTSLDELPQFINVLQGNMSIVGPRPHAVEHNEEYRQLVHGYMLRHKVKPGITGWAQINGWRGETDTLEKMEKRIEYDLSYIHRWSLFFDLKIIFMTVFKGFVNKNAY
jgi:putative colanic acid biosynthesis UDP-glucose lipid carrier transferase